MDENKYEDKPYSLEYFEDKPSGTRDNTEEQRNTRDRSYSNRNIYSSSKTSNRRSSTNRTSSSRRPHDNKKRGIDGLSKSALENGFSIISLLVIVPIFFIIAFLILVLPHPTVSETENRTLATMPSFSFESYFSGSFTSSIAKCYDDTVPFRDDLKNASNSMLGLLGFPSSNNVKVTGKIQVVNSSKSEDSSVASPTDVTSSNAQQPTEAATDKDYTQENADANYNNGLISVNQDGHWRALELFGGGSGTSYIEALNDIHAKLGSSVKVYSMPNPLACEFYTPLQYSDYTTSQSDCFNKIAGKMNSGIASINPCDVLKQHTTEPIYCRTDHHWQPLGAYYASQLFASTAGVPFADISTYTPQNIEGFVGTMYAFTGDVNIKNDPETFTYYVPKNKYKTYYYDQSFNFQDEGELLVNTDTDNAYLTFMGGDDSIVKVKTDVTNGRKLCVVKDSYGNAEIPFYTSSFSEIYVMDMRYSQINLVNFVKDLGITDLLFTCSSYSVVGENADNLANLISQNSSEKIVDEAVTASASSKVTAQ
ncbi:MAG TPA: hypothetical protein GX401_02045 [Clostridiales bacterium]|nr:hypothetical protein [Clostridiales bacterium]